MAGHLESIFIAPAARVALVAVPEVVAIADRGLAGDRYSEGTGAFSRWPGLGRAVSLIAAEAIEAILREANVDLAEGRSRRNLVTRDVDLASLNGRKFRIGDALFRGARLCAPCGYLERLVGPGAFAALRGRGGLRADILESGLVRAGDAIRPI